MYDGLCIISIMLLWICISLTIVIYEILLEEFVFYRWIRESLEALKETERGEDQAWINRLKPGMLSLLPIPILIV